MKKLNKTTIYNIIVSIVSVAVVAGIGRSLTNADSAWYMALQKPSQFMPSLAFPIVWSIIYLCFAVVIFLLLRDKQLDKTTFVLL